MSALARAQCGGVEELERRLGELRACVLGQVDALEELVARLPADGPSAPLKRAPTAQPKCPEVGPAPDPPCGAAAAAACGEAMFPKSTKEIVLIDSDALEKVTQSLSLAESNSAPCADCPSRAQSGCINATTSFKSISSTKSMPGPTSSVSSFNVIRRGLQSGRKTARHATRSTSKSSALSNSDMPSWFEALFATAIVASGVMSGVEVQWKANHLGEDVPIYFSVSRNSFTALFLIEIVSRICKMGPRKFFVTSEDRTWAWLDLSVVIGGIIEACAYIVLISMTAEDRASNSGLFRNVRMIRIVRITRAFRLPGIVRVVSGLKTLVYSISVTLRSLMWAMILLLIIVYVFGIAFTMEAVDFLEYSSKKGEDLPSEVVQSWGSLDRSMFTLYKSISGGVSWGEPLDALAPSSIIPAILFTVYVAFTYFAVLNVVTGVFCSSALETTQRNPDLVAKTILERRRESSKMLRDLFGAIDDDDSGVITSDELESITGDDMVRAYFQALDIDFRDTWTLFKLIDTENTGAVKKEDFLLGCEQLRGGATNVHMAQIASDVKKLGRKLNAIAEMVEAAPSRVLPSVTV